MRLLPRALSVVVVAGLLVPVAAASSPAIPHRAAPADLALPPAVAPVAPEVHEYAVRDSDGPTTSTELAGLSSPELASGFAVVGATWEGQAPQGLQLDVRTETDDVWSDWEPLHLDAEHGPTPGSAEARGARPGTDPYVVGDVDVVQLRAVSATGAAPPDLRLSVVDPGATRQLPADQQPKALTASGAVSQQPAATAGTPRPTIYSRAQWGADEGMRDCCVEYGEVHAGFVHHTVSANDYTRAEVPAIIRGIYAYHTQSRGWRDIGYNFLVDRFGRIWEGRAGGIDRPVIGAHTLYYNENAFAASAIGNFDVAHPSRAVINAYARLYAWKLSLHGVRPRSQQWVAGTNFNAISGHRDAAQTACPGQYLYARLPAIRKQAAQAQSSFAGRDLAHSFLRSSQPDLLLVSKADGRVSMARGTGSPGFTASDAAPWSTRGFDRVAAVGDVTGDRRNDLMARSTTTGGTSVLSGSADGAFQAAAGPSGRWADSDLFAGPGDLDGDGNRDVVARDDGSAALQFYPGNGRGGFRAGTPAGRLAGSVQLTPAGDFDGDGDQDLLVLNSAGAVWALFGNGSGRFPTRARIATNWSTKDLISGGVDLSGDGLPDVVARTAKTKVARIHVNVDGTALSPGVAAQRTPGKTLLLSRDITGDRKPDLLTVSRTNILHVSLGARQNWLSPARVRTPTWPGMKRVMVVGDWDGDGSVDAMAQQASTGKMWLYPGRAKGGFGDTVGGWPGWGTRSMVTPVGDFDGDGRPDLMARAGDGHLYLYPGRGSRGFAAPEIMRSELPSGASLVAVGLWDGDGAPDVLVKTTGGTMLLYPGNGPGGLDDPRTVAGGFGRYQDLVGVGDVTGDGQPDLLARTKAGVAWLVPGVRPSSDDPAGGFAPRQYVASGWSGFRLG